MNRIVPLAAVFAVALLLEGCATPRAGPPADWIEWRARRAESVAGTNGWTTLIGLHWLHEGSNSAGSSPANDALLQADHIPALIGTFTRHGSTVSFIAAPNVDVQVSGERVQSVQLVTDASKNPTRLQIGTVNITVIERGERIGLRVRDAESAARRDFKEMRYLPYDPASRLEGRFSPFREPRKLHVPDVTGSFQDFSSPGEIVFSAHGSERRLAVAIEPDIPEFFVMFHDETAGDSTYPAGRFLYVEKPVSGDRVLIDFNRAYTPPCGFTEFATCPLPPRQNWLPFRIKAGELAPPNIHRLNYPRRPLWFYRGGIAGIKEKPPI